MISTTIPTSALRAPAISRGFGLVLASSVALHLAVLAGYAWWDARKLAVLELPDETFEVKVVRLGKPRDQKLLPRIDQAPRPAPAPAAEKAVAVPTLDKKAPVEKAADKPKEKEKEKPKPADDEDFKDRMKSAMDKLRATEDRESRMKEAMGRFAQREGPASPTKEEPEGQPDGDPLGDSPTPSQVNAYLASIGSKVKQHYIIPSVIQTAECMRLVATVMVRMDPEGKVLDADIHKGSGSDIFDNAVIKAVKDASPLPSPPPNMRQLVHTGFGFKFRCDR